jgi:LacI family transcriptional regulator
MAIGAMAAIIDAGLDIPEDVSVIGCDNITAASYVRPSLTTIALPIYEMGVAAMETMLTLFAGDDCPPVRVLPSTLVMRQSTAPPRQGSHQKGEQVGK